MPFDSHGRFIWSNSAGRGGGVDQVDDFDMTPLIRTKVFDIQDNADNKGDRVDTKKLPEKRSNSRSNKYQDQGDSPVKDSSGPSKSNSDYFDHLDRFGHKGTTTSYGNGNEKSLGSKYQGHNKDSTGTGTGPSTRSNNDYSDHGHLSTGSYGSGSSNDKSSSSKYHDDDYEYHRNTPIKDSTGTGPSRSARDYSESGRIVHQGQRTGIANSNAHGYDSYSYDNSQHDQEQQSKFGPSTSTLSQSLYKRQTSASGPSSTCHQDQIFHIDNDNYNTISKTISHFGQSEQPQIQKPLVYNANQNRITSPSGHGHGSSSSTYRQDQTFHDDNDNYNFSHFGQPDSQAQKPMDYISTSTQNVVYKRRQAPPAPVLSAQNCQMTSNSTQQTLNQSFSPDYRHADSDIAQAKAVKNQSCNNFGRQNDSSIIETETSNYNYNPPQTSSRSSSKLYDPISAHFDDHDSSPPGPSSKNKYKSAESHGYGYEEPEENDIDILGSTYRRPFIGQPPKAKYKMDDIQIQLKPATQTKNEITDRPKSILKNPNYHQEKETKKAAVSTTETRTKKPSAYLQMNSGSGSGSTVFNQVKEANKSKSNPIVPYYEDVGADVIEIRDSPSPPPFKRSKIDCDLKLYCDLILYDKLLLQIHSPNKGKQNFYPADCIEASINGDSIKVKLSKIDRSLMSSKKKISQLVTSWNIHPILELPLDCIKKVKIVFVDSRTRFTFTFFEFLTDEPNIAKIKENLRNAFASLAEDQVSSSKYFAIYSNSIGDKEIEKFKTIFGNHNVIVDLKNRCLAPNFGQYQYIQCYCKSIKFGTLSLCRSLDTQKDSPYILNILLKPNGPTILVRIIESARVKGSIDCKIAFPYDKRNKYYLMHLGASSWVFYFLLYNADVIPELESYLKDDNVADHFNPNSSDPKKIYISFIVKYTSNILERKEKAISAIERIFDNYDNFIGPPPNSLDIFENQEKECFDIFQR